VGALYGAVGWGERAAVLVSAGLLVLAAALWWRGRAVMHGSGASGERPGGAGPQAVSPRGGPPPWWLLLAACAAAAAAAVAGTAADAAAREDVERRWPPGTLVEATLRLGGSPTELASGSSLVPATVERLGENTARGGIPASVFVPDAKIDDAVGASGVLWTTGTVLRCWVSVREPGRRTAERLTLSVVSAPTQPPRAPKGGFARVRAGLLASVRPFGSGALAGGAALVPGVVTGDRSLQDPELAATMKASGLSHLTAVSGSNVALALAAVAAACRLLRIPRRLRPVLSLTALVAFVVLVGTDPSVLRAAVSGGVGALALVAGRPRAALALTCAAVVVLVAADPWQPSRPAFQLSVAATVGIAVAGAPLGRFLHERMRVPRVIAEAIAVSASATIACTPVLAGLSPQQSALTVPVNVLAAPAAAVIGLLGPFLLIFAPFSAILPTGAYALVTWPIAAPCVAAGQAIAGLGALSVASGARVSWPPGAPGILLAAAVCWVMPLGLWWGAGRLPERRKRPRTRSPRAVLGRRRPPPRGNDWLSPHRRLAAGARRRRLALRLISTLLVVVLGCAAGAAAKRWGPVPASLHPVDGDIVLCDVGQGDATLLVGDAGRGVLIDVGPRDGGVSACLRRSGVRSLCALFLTHLDADHVGDLAAALRRAPAAALYYGTADRDAPAPEAVRARGGEEVACGHWDVVVRLAPHASEENDASLVLRARSDAGGGLDLLDAGDLESTGAVGAVAQGAADPGDDAVPRVLKVSHHGARNGGTELLDTFRPRLALIGVGAHNDYGHPAPVTLDALAAAGVTVRRTDLDGTVVVRPGAAPGEDPLVGGAG